MVAYKREGNNPSIAWNELIRRANELADECGFDADLEEVDPNHIWKKSDVQAVYDKLREICDENEFDPIPATWKQSIINQFIEAIERGCCGCTPIDKTDFPLLNVFETSGGYKLLIAANSEGTWNTYDWAGWIMQEVESLTTEEIECPEEGFIERRSGGRGWVGREYTRWEMFMFNSQSGGDVPIKSGDVIDGYIDIGEGTWRPEQACGEPLGSGTPLGEEDPAWGFEYTTRFQPGPGFFVVRRDGAEVPASGLLTTEGFINPAWPTSPYVLKVAGEGGVDIGPQVYLRLTCP